MRSVTSGASLRGGWCHGTAGTGLARLGILGLVEDAWLQGEIDAALDATLAQPASGCDTLCCGNFGRIEFLLTAGRRLGRANLVDAARQRSLGLLASAAERGGFALESS